MRSVERIVDRTVVVAHPSAVAPRGRRPLEASALSSEARAGNLREIEYTQPTCKPMEGDTVAAIPHVAKENFFTNIFHSALDSARHVQTSWVRRLHKGKHAFHMRFPYSLAERALELSSL